MTELRERILAELDRREDIAHLSAAAGETAWHYHPATLEVLDGGDGVVVPSTGTTEEADLAHIALHDPADALARYTAARRVLARHQGEHRCEWCAVDFKDWPCAEILDLAASLSLDDGEAQP